MHPYTRARCFHLSSPLASSLSLLPYVRQFCVFVTFANVVPLAYQIVIKVKTKIIEDTVDSTEPWNYILMWCMTLGSFLLSVVVKTAGAPESCAAPGKHDIYFHSHQFWHVCVNISSVLNLLTWRTYMEWRLDTPCPA